MHPLPPQLPASAHGAGALLARGPVRGLMPWLWLQAIAALERLHAAVASRSIVIEGRRISYLEGGFGPVVLLIHDFFQTKEAWMRFAGGLTHYYPYYRVIIPDLSGFGASSACSGDHFDIESQTRRLHDFLRALGIERYHVLGAGMGGEIAGFLAHHWPDEVSSLALLDPDGIPSEGAAPGAPGEAGAQNPGMPGAMHAFHDFLRLNFHRMPWFAFPTYALLHHNLERHHDQLQSMLAEVQAGAAELLPLLPDIEAPTLILWGDHDQVAPAASAAVAERALPHADLDFIKDCGHLPAVEHPWETVRRYLDFIARH